MVSPLCHQDHISNQAKGLGGMHPKSLECLENELK